MVAAQDNNRPDEVASVGKYIGQDWLGLEQVPPGRTAWHRPAHSGGATREPTAWAAAAIGWANHHDWWIWRTQIYSKMWRVVPRQRAPIFERAATRSALASPLMLFPLRR